MIKIDNIKHFFEKNNKLLFYIAFSIYMVVTIIGVIFHEVWLDEAQAWLISQDLNFFQILQQMHHEGHLFVWYVLLMPLTKFNVPYPLPLQILNMLIMWIAVFILWKKAPFNPLIKLLITFSAPICFVYTILARCYSVGILLLFLLAAFYKDKFKMPYLYAFLIILCANTSLLCLIAASGFGILFVFEYISEKKDFYKSKEFYILCSIGIFGIVLVLYQILGALNVQDAFDSNLGRSTSPFYIINRITYAMFGLDFMLLKDKANIFIQNILLCSFYLIVSTVFFTKNKKALFYYLYTYSCFIFVLLCIYNGFYVHYYFFFIYFIISYWLFKLFDTNENKKNITYFIFNILLLMILFSLCLYNCKLYSKEINEKYSNTKALVQTLYKYKNENILICDLWGYSFVPYLRNQNMNPDSIYTGKPATFIDYTPDMAFNNYEIENIMTFVKDKYKNENVYLITQIWNEWEDFYSEDYTHKVLQCENGGFMEYPDMCIVELKSKK